MSVYEFTVKARDGSDVSLSDYRGDVLLIVNTATESKFVSQYAELERLYEKYKNRGFEILDFPCGQFSDDIDGLDDLEHDVCTDGYGVTFPQFSRVDVKGKTAIPLYRWLSNHTYFDGFGVSPRGILLSREVRKRDRNYRDNNDVKWDFTKFLIDRTGYVVERFEPTDMKRLEEGIGKYI